MILSGHGKHRWCFIILMLFFNLTISRATNYPVSNAAQISSVMSTQAQPGDTLTMSSGTWTDQQIVFQGNGTATQPIVLCAQGGYGSVVLNGTSRLRIGGNYLVVDGLQFQGGRCSKDVAVIEFRNSSILSNYSRLTNSAVLNYNPTNDSTDYKWVSLYGTHNRVDHCHLEGKTHSGTTLVVWRPTTAPDYHLIDHNYFGPRPELGYNGGETIRVGTSDQSLSSSFTTVEYNLFDRCNGEIEAISNKSCDNIYRYNTFISCQATLTLRHGNHCLVEGNFFFGNHEPNSGGIRIIGEDHTVINNYIAGTDGSSLKSALTLMDGIPDSPLSGYYQVKRALVAFNTLVGNRYSLNLGGGKDADNILPPLDCIIANNVVYGTYAPLITQTDSTINTTWQSNIFYGASLGMSPVPSGITVTDPKLAPVGGDSIRHVSGTSPAIDAAEGTYSIVALDLDGQMRDSQKDIGADEYSSAPMTIRPLTIADVGPNAASFTISVTQGAHGTVTPGTTAVRSGDSQRFIFNPDPNYNVDSVIVDGLLVPDSTTGYTFRNVMAAHSLTVQYSTNQFTVTVNAVHGVVSIDPEQAAYDSGSTVSLTALPETGYHFAEWSGDATGTANPLLVTMNADKTITANFSQNEMAMILRAGWNLLSLPSDPEVHLASLLFPDAVSDPFRYDGSYITGETLMTGSGFWLKFAVADTLIWTGIQIEADTIDLQPGWNLIGSISSDVSTTTIVADPPDLIVSHYFLYDGSSYRSADTIRSGVGYWVKADTAGEIILSGTVRKSSVSRTQSMPVTIQNVPLPRKRIER